MKHKLAYIEVKYLGTELNLMTRSHFIDILMILTKYVFDLGVWLTEFSVTVESVTLRFYSIKISRAKSRLNTPVSGLASLAQLWICYTL